MIMLSNYFRSFKKEGKPHLNYINQLFTWFKGEILCTLISEPLFHFCSNTKNVSVQIFMAQSAYTQCSGNGFFVCFFGYDFLIQVYLQTRGWSPFITAEEVDNAWPNGKANSFVFLIHRSHLDLRSKHEI